MAAENDIVAIEKRRIQEFDNDHPNVGWVQTALKTMGLVRGFRGKFRALGVLLLRVLP